jgi:hypothetical protein
LADGMDLVPESCPDKIWADNIKMSIAIILLIAHPIVKRISETILLRVYLMKLIGKFLEFREDRERYAFLIRSG